MRFDPIRAIEASYAGAVPEEAWLRGIAEAFLPISFGQGVVALAWNLESGRFSNVVQAQLGPLPFPAESAMAPWRSAPARLVESWFAAVPVVDTALHRARLLGPAFSAQLARYSDFDVRDVLRVVARDPSGRCVSVSLPADRPLRVGPRTLHRLIRVAAHFSTAARLRALVAPSVDAVLDPAGKVQHAEGPAKERLARASLTEAVKRTERARGGLRRSDPDEALELWRGLVDGRWSLVEHVETDGRRLLLARRNPPGAPDPKALTQRERDVLAYVVQGHTNKYVAYTLGLSGATIAAHLKRALSKLGVRTRGQAIELLTGAAATRTRQEQEER
jgi:DNA-binding CsgD family transcriptional regulator